MSVVYAVETFDQCWHDAPALFVRHKEELGSWEESELAPSADFWRKASAAGLAVLLTVRDDGALVGYAAYMIQAALNHYRREIWASSDTFFVAPEYRGRGIGDEFYGFIELEMRRRGAVVIQTSVRADHVQGRALGALLVRRGCVRKAVVYGRRLD